MKLDPAETAAVNAGLLGILWHSLGMRKSNHRRALKWWLDDDKHRNHFATGPDCDGFGDVVALVALGLMERGREIPGGLTYYHVTEEGIRLAKREFAGSNL